MKIQLSEQAAGALVNTGTNRQGTPVTGTGEVLAELARHGLIGPCRGMTRAGTIERMRIVGRLLNELF